MPRRSILTAAQRKELLAFPDDESELIRLYTLSGEDRDLCGRIGVAATSSVSPSKCATYDIPVIRWTAGTPHAPLLGIVAAQLDVPPGLWDHYAKRR